MKAKNHKRSFVEKLGFAIEKHGQVKVAKVLGYSQPTISFWLNGIREPALEVKQALRDKLHKLMRENYVAAR